MDPDVLYKHSIVRSNEMKKVMVSHVKSLSQKVDNRDDVKFFLKRSLFEKIPRSRIQNIELGRWFAEKILELNSKNETSFKTYFQKLTT